MKYRKKPVVIEAIVWDRNPRTMLEFLGGKSDEFLKDSNDNFYIDHDAVDGGLVIKTSEGDMTASIGDYIIKEPFDKDRRFYPCKPDIFKKTYEAVEEND